LGSSALEPIRTGAAGAGEQALPTNLNERFQVWSQAVEARFGSWPTWMKLIVFMPLLILMSGVLVALLGLLGAALQGLGHH
jgi:hypothetical protein